MKADLHIHTTESDGCLTVEEVLSIAAQRKLNFLAITDHETTSGVEKARDIGLDIGITVIPGVEFNTSYRQEEVHLLGYYRDINNDCLQERLLKIRRERSKITQCMVARLQQDGLPLKWEQVEERASREGIICKTHILYTVWNLASENKEIRWEDIFACFRPGGIAHIPYLGNPFEEAVDFIFTTGGVPVLAHPGLIRNKSLIIDLLAYRPIGLEVYYGYWDQAEDLVTYFQLLAQDMALFSTGGSDYHGFYSPVQIGQVHVPGKCVEDLKTYLQID